MMKNGKRYLLVAIVLLLATVLFSSLAMAEEEAKPITSIKFLKSAYEFDLERDEEYGYYLGVEVINGTAETGRQMAFSYEPAEADLTKYHIRWSVSDTRKYSYSYGFVYAGEVGTVNLIGKVEDDKNVETGVSVTVPVTFKLVPEKQIVFGKNEVRIYRGWGEDDDEYIQDYLNGVWVEPAKATYTAQDLTWESDKPEILRVNANGKFVARKVGEATVTATAKGDPSVKRSVKVTVWVDPVTSLSFKPTSFELNPYEGLDLKDDKYLIVEPSYAVLGTDTKEVRWTSSDAEIFNVSDNGYGVAGKKEGTATVTVEVLNYDGTTVSASCTVKVAPVALKALSFTKSSITLKENSDSINLGDYLKKDPVDADVPPEDLCWESSNPQVVYIDEEGYLWIVGAGSATISVYYKDNPAIEASIEVIVSNLAVNNVRFDRKALTLYYVAKPESKSDVYTYEAVSYSVEPKDAIVKYVTVETSNAKVAVAQIAREYENGYGEIAVRAVGKGKCKITVYVNDGKTNYTAQLKVTVTDKGPSAKLNYKNLTLEVGKKATLVAKDTNKLKLSGKWSSSDKSIAKVNKKGVVKAKNPGRCVITFTPKSKSIRPISCQVKVVKPAN